MGDLKERLRNRKLNEDSFAIPLRYEAAARIEQLEAENAGLHTANEGLGAVIWQKDRRIDQLVDALVALDLISTDNMRIRDPEAWKKLDTAINASKDTP